MKKEEVAQYPKTVSVSIGKNKATAFIEYVPDDMFRGNIRSRGFMIAYAVVKCKEEEINWNSRDSGLCCIPEISFNHDGGIFSSTRNDLFAECDKDGFILRDSDGHEKIIRSIPGFPDVEVPEEYCIIRWEFTRFADQDYGEPFENKKVDDCLNILISTLTESFIQYLSDDRNDGCNPFLY